ncbi:membrane protein [Phytomonospora endophytica]|nr:membrane protein [Phytomonospora endophytica]
MTVAALAWGTGGAVAVVLEDRHGLGPVAVSFWRFAVAAVAVVALRLLRPVGNTAENLRAAVLSGAGLALSQAAYFAAVGRAGLAVGTLVTIGASPVLIALGARFLLGERVRGVQAAVLCAAVGGLVLLAGRSGPAGSAPALGVGLALVSAFAYSAVILHARRSRGGGAGPAAYFTGTVLLAPFALIEGLLPATGAPAAAAGWLLFLGIVPTALAYRWFFAGLATVPAATAAVIALLEPLAASLIALILLGERIGAVGVAGAVVLLASLGVLGVTSMRQA